MEYLFNVFGVKETIKFCLIGMLDVKLGDYGNIGTIEMPKIHSNGVVTFTFTKLFYDKESLFRAVRF